LGKNTFKVLKKYLDRQHSYIDVGAWVGPTVLYGSQLSRHAYAIESDPVAICYLRKNISLNPDLIDKISVIDYCIGSENGIVRLGTKTAGDSESSLLSIGEAKFFHVKSITFDTLIESFKINDCNLSRWILKGRISYFACTEEIYQEILSYFILIHTWISV